MIYKDTSQAYCLAKVLNRSYLGNENICFAFDELIGLVSVKVFPKKLLSGDIGFIVLFNEWLKPLFPDFGVSIFISLLFDKFYLLIRMI
jgi:hypothetical protein